MKMQVAVVSVIEKAATFYLNIGTTIR